MRRAAAAVVALLAALGAGAEEVQRRFGQLTVAVDTAYAQPGGIAVVRFRSARPLGSLFAIFEGRRAPAQWANGGPRALVPIPLGTPPGAGLLGIELYARSGVQRLRLDFPILPRRFGERVQTLSEQKQALLRQPHALRDGRRLMQALRTLSAEPLWGGPFRAPVAPQPADTFGEREVYVGGSPVEMMMDGGFGDEHRGLDFALAPGHLVQAPAGGSVVMAEPLLLTGQTVVIDHGQGLVSLLCHMSQLEVEAGQRLAAGARLGLAGETGLATYSHLHWATYLHGIPVDPAVVMKVIE
jgi:murein DD-endopeptidase MepM/ murein hydrolase activator NlpD